MYRRREDMAADLLALFQGELPASIPWSEARRRESDARHDPPLAQTFKETAEARQRAAIKKSRRRSTKSVSYTHLDVYKRQEQIKAINIQRALINEEQRTNDCDYVIPESATAPGSPDGSYMVGEINGSYEKLPA